MHNRKKKPAEKIKKKGNKRQRIEDGSFFHHVLDTTFDDFTPHLTANSIVSLSQTCKTFHGLFNDSLLWKRRYQADFGILYFDEDYKEQYIAEKILLNIKSLAEKTRENINFAAWETLDKDRKKYLQALGKHINKFQEKKWTFYYSINIYIYSHMNFNFKKKIIDKGWQAIAAGDIRTASLLILIVNLDMRERANSSESRLFAIQLFWKISALINNNPIDVNDYDSLYLALKKMPNKSAEEKTRCVHITRVFCLIYCTLYDNREDEYFKHAEKLYLNAAYSYLNDNVKDFIDFTTTIARAMDENFSGMDKGDSDGELFKTLCLKTQASNVIEAASTSLFMDFFDNFTAHLLTAYLKQSADNGDAASAYFYGMHLNQNFSADPIEKAISYFLKAIAGKDYRAVSKICEIACQYPEKEFIAADVLDELLREGIRQGNKSCVHTMAIEKVKNILLDKADEDLYTLWILQMDASMTIEIMKNPNLSKWDEHPHIFWNLLVDAKNNINDNYNETMVDWHHSMNFLKSRSEMKHTTIYAHFAFAMVCALKYDKDKRTDQKLLSLIKKDYFAFQEYLNAGKEYGLYTPAHDEVVRRVLPEVVNDMEVNLSKCRFK